MAICSVLDCGRPTVARGYCNAHWKRWKQGLPLDTPIQMKHKGGRPCTVDNCGRRAVSDGLCNTHRERREVGTDLTAPVGGYFMTDNIEERLRHYAPAGAPDECWEWTAALNKGYGAITVHGSRMRQAHVVAWEIHNDTELPAGMVIRHSCDNPPCTNPAHLELGTHADNSDDRLERGAEAYNGTGHRHRTDAEVREMRRLYEEGVNMTEISRRFGCSRATAMRICKGQSFPNVLQLS